MGDAGMDILHALAENKIKGNIGLALAQAAAKAVRESEGFATAHQEARLGGANLKRSKGQDLVAAVQLQLGNQQAVREQLCKLDFGKMLPRRPQ